MEALGDMVGKGGYFVVVCVGGWWEKGLIGNQGGNKQGVRIERKG